MPLRRLGSIDLNLLVVLDALLSEGSVTRAAAKLGLSQPAVSHALNRLRGIFDDPLMVRTPRGMAPTARAQQLVEPIREALAQLERALEEQRQFDPASARRHFTVAALDYAEFVLLPPLISHLARHAPGIELTVRAIHGDTGPLLASGEIDLAFGVGSEEAAGIYQQQLFKERFTCLVRKGHPEVKQRLSLEQYVRLAHILIAPRGGRGSILDDALAERGLSRRIAVSVPHFLVAPLLVARTDLMLTIAERMAQTFAELLPLRAVPLPLELEGFSMRQFWHERHNRDPAHVWLRSAVAELARKV